MSIRELTPIVRNLEKAARGMRDAESVSEALRFEQEFAIYMVVVNKALSGILKDNRWGKMAAHLEDRKDAAEAILSKAQFHWAGYL